MQTYVYIICTCVIRCIGLHTHQAAMFILVIANSLLITDRNAVAHCDNQFVELMHSLHIFSVACFSYVVQGVHATSVVATVVIFICTCICCKLAYLSLVLKVDKQLHGQSTVNRSEWIEYFLSQPALLRPIAHCQTPAPAAHVHQTPSRVEWLLQFVPVLQDSSELLRRIQVLAALVSHIS